MAAKLENSETNSKWICQCNKTEKHDKSDWHISHNPHQNAFETFIQYIQDKIVEKKLSTLPLRYQQILCVIATRTASKFRITVQCNQLGG